MRMSRIIPAVLVVWVMACDSATEPRPGTDVPIKAGAAARLYALTATDLDGRVGTELEPAPAVRAVDSHGRPVAGVEISFRLGTGAGEIAVSSVATDGNGTATVEKWTLPLTIGMYTLSARAEGLAQVVFGALAYESATDLQGRLAFVSHRDGNREIYAIDADGGRLARLTTNSGYDEAPAWSPDGSQIAFVSDADGPPHIQVMTEEGARIDERLDVLDPRFGTSSLAWSPAGTEIAFTAFNNGRWSIATVDIASTIVRVLTISPGLNNQPAWSPDGRRLAFVSDRAAYDLVTNIYTMNADGSDEKLLTEGLVFWPRLAQYLHPVWSPDGSMIAFVHADIINTSDVRFKVGVMSADGTYSRDLARAGDFLWTELLDPGAITWSPDGRGVAYTFYDCDLLSGSSCSRVRSVRYVSLDGQQRETIVENADSPSWRR